MLNFFRRKDATARYLLGGILVVICFAMVMFLIPGFGGGGGVQTGSGNNLASVAGQQISVQDFDNEINRLQQTQRLPMSYLAANGGAVLNNLVMRDALADAALSFHLSASKDEIAAAIKAQMPELFPGGVFVGEARYADYVQQATQLSVPQFEASVRQQVLEQKLYHLITDGLTVSPEETRQAYERRNAKATFQYVVLNPDQLAAQVPVTPAALRAYYQAHETQYMAPERRSLKLLLADVSQFAARVNITPQDVASYYQANLANYTFPERAQVAHILFKTAGDSPAQAAQSKQRAEAALKKLQSGVKFADVAKQMSQDDATAGQGGELGWITRGRMVPAVEQAAFSLPVGQTSGVIPVSYGFEIIKVEAREAAHVEPLAQAQAAIADQLRRQQGLNAAQQAANQARLEVTNTPAAEVAKKYGLQLITTPPLGRTDPVTGIGVNAEFEEDVFTAPLNSYTPVVQVPTGFALAQVTSIQPEAVEPLAAVQGQVESDYRKQQSTAMAAQEAAQLQKAAAREGLAKAAAAQHLKVATSPALGSDGSLPGVGDISSFADQLLALQPGQVGPVAQLPTGNQLVYSLVKLEEPPPAQYAQQAPSVAASLLDNKRQVAFQAYADQLRDRLLKSGKIQINEALLKTTLGGMTQAGQE